MIPSARPACPSRHSIAAWLPWLTWGLAAGYFSYAFFHRVAPSVIIDPLMRDLQVGGAVLGNLSAFYFYAYAGLQLPVGFMAARWGPRRLLTVGALVCAAGSLVFAEAGGLPAAYLGRLMIGAGSAVAFVSALRLAVNWFPRSWFGRVSALTMVGGMLGGISGQAPLAALVEAYGWRPTLLWAGLAGLILAAAIWLIVRDHPAVEGGEPAPARSGSGASPAALLTVLKRPGNWLVTVACAAMTAPLLAFAGLWGVAWLMQIYGYSRPEAAGMASLLLIGWAVGAPLAGWLSDRLGRHKLPLLITLTLGALSLAVIINVPNLPAPVLSLLFFLSGACFGSMVIGFSFLREINPPQVAGAAFGFLNMSIVGTGAIFQPLIGWLLDLKWDGASLEGARVYTAEAYGFALSVLLIFLACGWLALLWLHETSPRLRESATD